MPKRRRLSRARVMVAATVLALLCVWPTLTVAKPLTAQQQLQRAWRLASDVGAYRHRTEVVQTGIPMPRLSAAGMEQTVDRLATSGLVDRREGRFEFRMESLGDGQPGLEVKIEGRKAYGRRVGDTEWAEMEDPGSVFASGNDPLGFLGAVDSVRQVPRGNLPSPEGAMELEDLFERPEALLPEDFTHFTFEIDGRRYAQKMASQLQAELRDRGELPAGISLGLADQYVGMEAHGELWLDERGLPARQHIVLSLPPEPGAQLRYEAEITTTFSGWRMERAQRELYVLLPRLIEHPSLIFQSPSVWLPRLDEITPAAQRMTALMVALLLLLVGVSSLVRDAERSRKLYPTFVAAVILSMVGTPLLRSGQALAFADRQGARQAERAEEAELERSIERAEAGLARRPFDPTRNPLTVAPREVEGLGLDSRSPRSGLQERLAAASLQQASTTCSNPVAGDADCDGNADDDGDGLTDQVERLQLGTDPDRVDTDGDLLSDSVEVRGFRLGGRQWYLDPLDADSNDDGIQDGRECIQLVDVGLDGSWPVAQRGTTCENGDTDATPDVFDFDNDGDGVPDHLDTAPGYAGPLQSSVSLELDQYSLGKTTLVDFQLRPENPDHLWQNNNVFDWPANDELGQITRRFSTTFADVGVAGPAASKRSNGDVLLSPMLQIQLGDPSLNTANPAASLPVDSAFSGDVGTAALAEWLDADMMADYAISVDRNLEDGQLYAYVPLAQVIDPVGEAPVAWTGQMVYRPEMATWGTAHTVKLIWLVTALSDRCDTSTMLDPTDPVERASHCALDSNWVTEQRVIQTYFEDFDLTGLTVTEDHGSKSAIVAQVDALSATYESHLWQLANGLQGTFVPGELLQGNQRFTVEEVARRFDRSTTPYSTGDSELWGIPDDKLVVRFESSVDRTTAAKTAGQTVPSLLGSTFAGAVADDQVNLLFAREDRSRTLGIEETGAVTVTGNAIRMSLSPSLLSTYASVHWAPYSYDGSSWSAADGIDFALDVLEPALATEIDSADLQAIVAGESIPDEERATEGTILLAKFFYMTFLRGIADLVEVEGTLAGSTLVDDAEFATGGQKPVTLVTSDMIALVEALIREDRTLSINGTVVANSDFDDIALRSFLLESASFGEAMISTIISESAGQLGGSGFEWVGKKVYKNINNFSGTSTKFGKFAKRSATVSSVLSTAAGVSLAVGFGSLNEKAQRRMLIAATSLTATSDALATISAINKLQYLQSLKPGATNNLGLVFKEVAQQATAVKRVIKFSAVVGVATEIVVAVGFLAITMLFDSIEFGSLQANLLLSETVGAIVVAILTLAISLTALGVVIASFFALVDAAISLICELLDVDPTSKVRQWVCGGFSGAIALGVSYLIYDYYTPYDVGRDDRLDIAFKTSSLRKNTDTDGFVAGNSIRLGATITNTLHLANPERVLIRTSYLDSSARLDSERLKSIGRTSTFSFSFETPPLAPAPEAGLTLNGTTWQGDQAVFNLNQEVVLGEGVNTVPQLYLTEAYDLATIECWGFIGAIESATCEEDRELKGKNRTFIGNIFTFDVLPEEVDGLPDFMRAGKAQLDADGDGLRSQGSGLIDPDDSDWDSDDDGLSDFWELGNAGFDAMDPDSDDDGLFDYWEAYYQTNPAQPDTDGDGLTDGEEHFHSNARSATLPDDLPWSGGWDIVYDYDGTQPLQTRVSADPLDADSDIDTILDLLERAYGYHPELPSILNVLTLKSQPDARAYLPSSTINYTATVKNELGNRVAFGLLEAEFPVDTLRQRRIINALYPKVEAAFQGSVPAPTANQSSVQDLVVRAGALINRSAVDEVFVLPFDEVTGATAFLDATSARKDFACTVCPTANAGSVTFNGSSFLARAHDPDFDIDPFSVSMWLTPSSAGGVLYDDLNDFRIEQLGAGTIRVTVNGVTSLTSTAALTTGQPNYVVVTYDAGSVTIFVNSVRSASSTSMGTIGPSNSGVEIGRGFQGTMDRVALHRTALTKNDIARVFGGLVAHVSFENSVDGCGFRDEISQRGFDCDFDAQRRQFFPNTNDIWFNGLRPRPGLINGPVGNAMVVKRFLFRDFDRTGSFLESAGNFLHFRHDLELAGTVPGENDNAFSVAMWLHPDYWPNTYAAPGSSTQEAILTMPDQRAIGFAFNNRNATAYSAGDGSQLRVWTTGLGRHLEVNAGGCRAGIADFMLDGSTSAAGIQFTTKSNRFWEHLVIAYDGNSTLKLFKNGVEAASVGCTTTTDFRSVDGFTIGYSSLDNDLRHYPATFSGYMDELRFYDFGFDEGDARELYTGTNVRFDFNGRTGQSFFASDSPSGLSASCSGAACPDSGLPSINNQGLRFEDGDYLELSATADEIGFTGDFTAMAWVKGRGAIFGGRSETGAPGFLLGVLASRPYFDLWSPNLLYPTSTHDTSRWHHLAFRYRELDANNQFLGEMSIYRDGVLLDQVTGKNPGQAVSDAYIGRAFDGALSGNQTFIGELDDVVIAEVALSEAEIRAYRDRAPVVNYHLDEGLENVLQSVDRFRDDGPNQLDARCLLGTADCPEAGNRGQMREAPVFDSSDYLYVEDDDALDLPRFSVGMWVRPQYTTGRSQTLVQKGRGDFSQANYSLRIEASGMRAVYGMSDACTTAVTGTSMAALNEDQWNHVMMTHDGAAMRIYLNGTLQGSTAFTGSPCFNTERIFIGSPGSGLPETLHGSIDEVTVHRVALDGQAIRALFDYQSSWFDTSVHNQVRIDADPPVLDLGPSPVFLGSGVRTLSLSAYDLGAGIETVTVTTTNPASIATVQQAVASEDDESAAFFYTFAPGAAGTYVIDVEAIDGLGFKTRATKRIDVDRTSPGLGPGTWAFDAEREVLSLTGVAFDQVAGPAPINGSGVDTSTLQIEVVDRLGVSIAGPVAVTDTVDSDLQIVPWSLDYPFPAVPYGLFNLRGSLTDRVANTSGTRPFGFTFPLDAVGPTGDVVIDTDVLGVDDTTVSGTASDIGYALTSPQTLFHFEEAAGATRFIDGTPGQVVVDCPVASCPSAGVAGVFGRAASFDGVDDRLDLGATPAISGTRPFAVSAWVRTSASTEQTVIQQGGDTPGNGSFRLSLTAAGTVRWQLSGVDGAGFDVATTATVNDGQWHHVLAQREVDGTGRIFIDGLEAVSAAAVARTLFDGAVTIGGEGPPANVQALTDDLPIADAATAQAGPASFAGSLDEVTIHAGALLANEVYYLARPLPAAPTLVEVRFRSFAQRDITPSQGTWIPARVTPLSSSYAGWEVDVPTLQATEYKIDLRITDSLGNTRYVGDAWTGAYQEIDLRVTSSVRIGSGGGGSAIAIAGEPVIVAIGVINNGPSPTTGVRITNTLPAELEYVSDSDSCEIVGLSMEGGQVLSCLVGDLAAGDRVDFEILARVRPDAVAGEADGTKTLVNRVEVDSQFDTDASNNVIESRFFVQDQADLKVTKICKPDRPAGSTSPGTDTFVCTLYVDNFGPSSARRVSLRDESLSDGAYSLVRWNLDPNREDQGPFIQASPESGQTIEFDLLEPLEPQTVLTGGRWVIELFYNAPDTADINNAVSVFTRDGGTPDPNMDNNMSMESVHVDGYADLELDTEGEEEEEQPEPVTVLSQEGAASPQGLLGIQGVPDPVRAGEQVVSTFTTFNNGPGSAINTRIEASLPPEVRIVDVTGFGSNGPAGCVAGTPGNPLDPALCQFGTLANGGFGTMEVTMLVLPDAVDDPVSDSKDIQVDARSLSDTFDPDLSDNFEFDPITVDAEADLLVQKFSEGPFPWIAGEERTYLVNVWNNGPSTAQHVEVLDQLPLDVEFLSAYVELEAQAGGVPLPCGATSDNTVICLVGDLPPSPNPQFPPAARVYINVRINSDVADGTTLTNVVDVLSDTPDPGPGANRATRNDDVFTETRIETRKTAVPHNPVAGTEFAYEIEVTNFGPSDATDLLITDVLPAGISFVASDDACVETLPGTIECRPAGSMGTAPPYVLPAGATESFSVIVRLDPDAAGDLINQTTTTTATPGATIVDHPNTVNVGQVADLRISKIVSPHNPVLAGEAFTYTIIVDNLGPSIADNVIITDTLIASGEVQATACTATVQTAGGLETLNNCDTALNTGVFDLSTIGINWLNPRSTTDAGRVIIEIVATADQPIDLTNTTTVTSDALDPNTDNNASTVVHSVTGAADLELILPCVPNPVDAGATTVCTFTALNNGPSDAINARIDVRFPVETAILDVTGTDAGGAPIGCTAGTPGNPADPTSCELGTLANGDAGTMDVTVLVDPNTLVDQAIGLRALQADAVASSDTYDPDFSDNVGFEPIDVTAAADLQAEKSGPAQMLAGTSETFFIEVQNNGPSTARDVNVWDFVPQGLRITGARVLDPSNTVCEVHDRFSGFPLPYSPANAVTCALGDLEPGPNGDRTIAVDIVAESNVPNATQLINFAFVGSGAFFNREHTPDPDPTNNEAQWTVEVFSQTELVVEKTAERLDPVAGTRHRYQVKVTNNGPADAFNVLVRDELPQGFRYVKDSDMCAVVATANNTDTIECRPAGVAPNWVLPAGQMVQFEILVELDPSVVCGEMRTNTACATADNAAQACGSARSSIECVADLRVRKFGKPDMMVRADQTLTYTVIVDNLGPSFTAPVQVTDTAISNGAFHLVGIIPDLTKQYNASCQYRSLNPISGLPVAQGNIGIGGTINPPVGPLPGHLEITCTNNGKMQVFGPNNDPADGPGRWVIQYVLRANDAQSINNVASVAGIDPDPDLSNNESAVEHDIKNVSDLVVSKTDLGVVQGAGCPAATAPMPAMRGMVTAGKTISWTITVTNTGPSMAENVKILDRLPPWITVVDYEIPGGSCTTGAPNNPLDQLTCGFGKALATTTTASAAVTITALVDPSTPAGTVLENDVMVMADPFDNNNANNFDSTLTTVKTSADLRIEKMDMPDPVKAGEELWYTVRVTNDGPSDAQFVVITDTLPAEVDFVSAATTKLSKVSGMCMNKLGVVTCALGTIPVGHFGEVLVKVLVKPDAVPPGATQVVINNTAVVGSMTEDPCLANNTVIEPTTVQRLSDVYVIKTDDPDPVLAGNVVTYTVTFGNRGPSTATSVAIVDVLPAGLTYVGCAPNTPANLVTCTEGPAGTITLNEIKAAGAIVWEDAPPSSALNDLAPGESYSFQIVALVDAGYVLDGRGDTGPGQACQALAQATGYPHYAHNNVTITAAFFDMMAGAPAVQTNAHDECTRVNGAADLKIDKTDIFGDPALNPDNWFLQCDPVEPGGMITYMLNVTNMGPSDAAQVIVMDWLPEAFVAVDPAQVMIEIAGGAGVVEEVRDTGKITLVIGNDNGMLGRLNAGNSVKVTIRVMVRQEAECGQLAINRAMVTTRALVGPPAVTSPTPDFDLTNNEDIEETKIECPSIAINKTVSYDGTCPGVDFDAVNQIGPGALFCFEITNTGTTFLDEIRITDTLRARGNGMPIIVFTDTIRHGVDPKVPVAPGEVVLRQHQVGPLNKECGRVTNTVEVTANPVNSGRTDLPCLDLVSASDGALIEVPCAGVDFRLQLPTLNTDECESWVQVQNVGDKDTLVLLVAWGDAGFCPPQAAGPLKAECSGLLRPGSAWSFLGSQLPVGSKSAVLYSLAADRVESANGGRLPFGRIVCEEFFFGVVGDDFSWAEFDSAYRERLTWRGLDFATYHGEPIAASVNRACPDPEDPNLTINAAYTGVSSDMEGARDPRSGSFAFFAPLVFAGNNGMNSVIHIQNSGTECSSLELWFKAQDNCLRPTLADVLSLAPGETVSFDPNTVVGPDWLGSAWIRATQPMGIVVDTKAGNHFTSYNGFAADIHDYGFTLGNMISYVPLIYSEYQGWDTAIQVQNLSAVTAAKVKVYFLDRSGDIITTLVDWVCPFGSQTFFLPVLADLPGNWVGSARVESQEWWAPGQPLVDPPRIASVALLEKWADPARTMRREAVAYNGRPECLLYDWQIADGTKGGLSSGSAVFAIPLVAKGNRGITSEIGITNLVPKPGFTDFAMYFYDQNGLLDHVCQKLNEKQVEYINLETWGFIHRGFLGSMVVSAVFWEHDVFDSQGRFERNLVGLGGVAVERIGGVLGGEDVPGDESKAFEAFPIFDHFAPEEAPNCPGVPGGFTP